MAAEKLNLPYLAPKGEPDVYETVGSLEPHTSHEIVTDTSKNESIDRSRIDPVASYSKFRGTSLQAQGADFSDSVARSGLRGYNGGVHYEANGEGLVDETIQERLERLQKEVDALQKDNDLLSLQHRRDGSFLTEANADFSERIAQLNMAISSMAHQKPSLQNSRDSSQLTTGADDASSKPRTDINAQAVALESRIKRLEQAFGSERDLNGLSMESSNSLMATVTLLKKQMSLLDRENLNEIESRMQQFLPKLTSVLDKLAASQTTDSDMEKKINEAHSLLKGWTATLDKVQLVVDRLVALKALHQQASSSLQLQEEMEAVQRQLLSKLQDLERNTEAAKESFAQAITTISHDIKQIESRFK